MTRPTTYRLNCGDQVVHPHSKEPVKVTARRWEEGRHGRPGYAMYRVTGGCYFGAYDLGVR